MQTIDKELLTVHTNQLTKNKPLLALIEEQKIPGIQYINLKQKIYHIVYNIKCVPICSRPGCNNEVKWNKAHQEYPNTCSRSCNNKMTEKSTIVKRKQTNIERYGGNAPACSPDVVQKMKATNIERYGENYTELNGEKSKLGMVKKHGVDNISQLEEVKRKKIETCMKNFNVPHPMQSKIVKDKASQTIQSKYGRLNFQQCNISDQSYQILTDYDKMFKMHVTDKISAMQLAEDLDVSVYTVYNHLKSHNIELQCYPPRMGTISSGHQELVDFIKEICPDTEIIINDRREINPKELDIFLPEFKLAIEFNGLYWHSSAVGTERDYHLQKSEECEKQGIRLIHIFEDEWNDQEQKCKDTIRHILGKSEKGIFARKVNIREIKWSEAKLFLDKHHLLGAGSSGNYRIGAFDPEENLIGVMVFGKQNNENSGNHVELRRFVTDKKNNPGLGSKMFNFAIKEKQYTEIVAFVDRRWFTGLVKDYIGFERQYATPPSLWWTNGTVRNHRRFITKSKLLNQLQSNDNLPINTSKRQMLESCGFHQLWDCGKWKLIWKSVK